MGDWNISNAAVGFPAPRPPGRKSTSLPVKSIPRIFPVLIAAAALARSQDDPRSVSSEFETTPATITTARIIGEIPDGTPPLPEPPKPVYTVAARDVLDAETYQEGGRTITFQRIAPPPMPNLPEAPLAAETIEEVSGEEQTADVPVEYAADDFVMAGASVFRSKDRKTRSLVQLWPQGGVQSVTFWSSADFGLLAPIGSFVCTDGKTRSLMLMWGASETDSLASLAAELGPDSPPIPEFAGGKASFATTTGKASDATLVWIQSLHDIYNSDYERLKSAYDGREQARLEKEAELKANPPKPKNLVFNYWRIGADAAKVEGGGK
jgi:hypothetical protein